MLMEIFLSRWAADISQSITTNGGSFKSISLSNLNVKEREYAGHGITLIGTDKVNHFGNHTKSSSRPTIHVATICFTDPICAGIFFIYIVDKDNCSK